MQYSKAWRRGFALALTVLVLVGLPAVMAKVAASPPASGPVVPLATPVPGTTPRAWVPIACRVPSPTQTPVPVCQPIPGASYSSTQAGGYPSGDPPAELHPDLNLSMRGWVENTTASRTLVDYNGDTDPDAPRLQDLFANRRAPVLPAVYRVYDWNWASNTRGALLNRFPVTLAGLAATPGETVHVPSSGYNIGGIGMDYEVLVLYADEDSITLKYTREDNVIHGYTLHLEGLCVEPSLLARYQANNAAGRAVLPGLVERQEVGRARGSEIQVAIRDNGTFMDPRSRKDWWQGVSTSGLTISTTVGRRPQRARQSLTARSLTAHPGFRRSALRRSVIAGPRPWSWPPL